MSKNRIIPSHYVFSYNGPGISANNGVDVGAENLQNIEDLPKDGSEWVELLVREMMNASNMDDARARASRVLDLLEKSIVARAGTELMQSSHKVKFF